MNKKNILSDLIEVIAKENNIKDVEWILERSFVSATAGYYDKGDFIHVILHPLTEEPTWIFWKNKDPIDDENLQKELKKVKQSLERKEEPDPECWEILPPIPVDRNLVTKIAKEFKKNIDYVKKSLEYDNYKDKVGVLVSGVVNSIDTKGNAIVSFEQTEGFLPYREMNKKETIQVGKRILCVIQSVEENPRRNQIVLSKASTLFFESLFMQMVPEVENGLIVIHKIAREAGGCTKIAVSATEQNVDPVRICVGLRGTRVQNLMHELGGEKVHVIPYDDNILNLAVNALNIHDVIEAYMEEEDHNETFYENDYNPYRKITIVVNDEAKSKAIGSHGQNVRLVSKMVGCRVDILSKTQFEQEKKTEESDRTA